MAGSGLVMLWVVLVVAAGFSIVGVAVAVVVAASLIMVVVVMGSLIVGYAIAICAYHQLILNMVPQVVLNVSQQLASQCIFARLVGQRVEAHLIEGRLAEELYHVHA